MVSAQIGILGLGVMGQNLALNLAEKGLRVAGHDAWPEPVDKLSALAQANPGCDIQGHKLLESFVQSLERPRRLILLVKAGEVVDATLKKLAPLLAADDIVVDGGNEFYRNTERRAKELEAKRLRYFGMGISGGEEGARHGPSLMPGGDRAGYEALAPTLEKIAAKADGSCVTYVGPGGSGHYVKMVHNGIEYGDMQLIAEAYDVLKHLGGLGNAALADTFEQWNHGELQSFLIEISAQILRKADPEVPGRDLIDSIADAASMKGTGKWTVQEAAEIGSPVPTIASAVDARVLSSHRAERTLMRVLPGPSPASAGDSQLVADVRAALYAAKACAYAQGFALLGRASQVHGFQLNLSELARIWTGGCIIRAQFLGRIKETYLAQPELSNLLLAPAFQRELGERQAAFRRVLTRATQVGLPLPAHASALAYYDTLRRERLPQNLTQAQRDYFGAHTYERIDRPWDIPHRVDVIMNEGPRVRCRTNALSPAPSEQAAPDARYCARDPFTLVIFGASGDLAHRKLLPALFHLEQAGYLPEQFSVIGFSRTPLSDDAYRDSVAASLKSAGLTPNAESKLLSSLSYVPGDNDDSAAFEKLHASIERIEKTRGGHENRLAYLSVAPAFFATIVEHLARSQFLHPVDARAWSRVIIEKPFGRDLESARQLNVQIRRCLDESQIYRIDHYLGKETVQNLSSFRFGNAIFEPLFNQKYIDNIQITVAETLGMEGKRGAYYDHAGALRDMVQNHMLQLLTIIAMEPPSSMDEGALRSEKVKVLRALVPMSNASVAQNTVRGQYRQGTDQGKPIKGYREELGVAPNSSTESYVAIKLGVDNWRWAGVPFYLRTGKRLARRLSEIMVTFKQPPLRMFQNLTDSDPANVHPLTNVLLLRIQPDEGIGLTFAAKRPGMQAQLDEVRMDFSYSDFHTRSPEAYERLLLDALRGDASLFTRSDEVECAWRFIQSIQTGWEQRGPGDLVSYAPFSEGPEEANRLFDSGGFRRLSSAG